MPILLLASVAHWKLSSRKHKKMPGRRKSALISPQIKLNPAKLSP
jgi:hypothetical protein